MKVQVKDIAKRAGVSAGTVSNALNNRKGISKEKREEILAIAKEMGYYKSNDKAKHHVIRFLILNKDAHVVGDTPFFAELIRGIEMECQRQGYELLMNHIYKNAYEDMEKTLHQDHVDGILLLGTEMVEEDFRLLEQIRIPTVIVDAVFRNQRYDYVAINNEDGAYDIVSHIIEMGHEHIGLINSSYQINNFRERKKGYVQALEDHFIPVHGENEALVEPSLEGAYRDMLAYLSAYQEEGIKLPTAFFAVNDNIAFGAMKAIIELHLQEHISIAGFDDMPFCEMCNPPLTTVKVDKQFLGQQAVQRLIQKIEHPEDGVLKTRTATRVVERKSVVQRLHK